MSEPHRLRAAALAGRAWAVTALDVQRTADEVLAVLGDVVDGTAPTRR